MANINAADRNRLLELAADDKVVEFEQLVTTLATSLNVTKGQILATPRANGRKTILHVAAQHNAHQVLGYCVVPDRWADREDLRTDLVDKCDREGKTAIHYASQKGNVRTAGYLIRATASADIRDNRGYMVVHDSVLGGSVTLTRSLLSTFRVDLDINDKTNDNETALHLAAATNDGPMTSFLVGEDVDETIVDSSGRTAREVAEDEGSANVLAVLDASDT